MGFLQEIFSVVLLSLLKFFSSKNRLISVFIPHNRTKPLTRVLAVDSCLVTVLDVEARLLIQFRMLKSCEAFFQTLDYFLLLLFINQWYYVFDIYCFSDILQLRVTYCYLFLHFAIAVYIFPLTNIYFSIRDKCKQNFSLSYLVSQQTAILNIKIILSLRLQIICKSERRFT